MIIFDEATAMLDPKGRQDVIDIIHKLNAEGMTILLITHFMEEAVDADQVVVMNNGFLLKKGVPEEIFFDEALLAEAGLLPPFAAQLSMDLKRPAWPLTLRSQERSWRKSYVDCSKEPFLYLYAGHSF